MCINIPNMKFLCLILWQVEVCTDADTDANDDGQSLIVEGSLVDKRNEPKKPRLNCGSNFTSYRESYNKYFTFFSALGKYKVQIDIGEKFVPVFVDLFPVLRG